MSQLAVLDGLIQTATVAVSLKRQLLKREMESTVCKDVHLKQFESVEKELIKALKPVFELQVKEAMAEPGKVLNKKKWNKRILKAAAPALIRGAAEAAKSQLLLMGVRRKSFELQEKFNPHHDHLGRFATGGGVGGMPSVSLPPKVDENILSGYGLTGILAGSGFRKKVLLDNGADEDGIAQMDQLFDWHRWGGDSQIQADQRIADEIGKDTPLGKTLRVQVAVETALLDRYEELKGKRIDAQEEQSKKDMKEAWEFGWGPKNPYAYDSWEEQWKTTEAYKFEQERQPLTFYRKGDADKGVLPTSLRSTGAQSHSVTGAAQPHFNPDHSWSAKELKDAGYGVLGGFGYNQMGYSGESEITWVKLPKVGEKNFIHQTKFNPHHDHLGRFATHGGVGGMAPDTNETPQAVRDALTVWTQGHGLVGGLLSSSDRDAIQSFINNKPASEAVVYRGEWFKKWGDREFDSLEPGKTVDFGPGLVSTTADRGRVAAYGSGGAQFVIYTFPKRSAVDISNLSVYPIEQEHLLQSSSKKLVIQSREFKGPILHISLAEHFKNTNPQTKASTATEYLLNQGLELPNNFLTEFPKVMQDRITGLLADSFDQDYWEEMTQTTQDDIERVIKAGVNSGVSIADLARQIDTLLGEDAYYHRRAENIARTEAGNALNGARKVAMEETLDGLPPELGARPTWLSVLSNTTRDSHANLDGVPAGKDGMWTLGGHRIPWPGHISLPPGERCFCKCTIVVSWGMDEVEARGLIADHYDRMMEEERSFTSELWEKFNPHHDHLGRFARARGSGMAETEVHEVKTLGGANGLKILDSKELGGGVNKSLLVDYVDKDGATRKAVFKPTNGARGREGFEVETIAAREVAASVIDQEMNLGMVGKVEHANLEGHGAGSLHEWVNTGATPAISVFAAAETAVGATGKTQAEFDDAVNKQVIPQFDKVANIRDMQYFDAMTGNVDRHLGNWLIKDGQAKLIDHGYSLASNDHYVRNTWDRFRTMEKMPKYQAPSPMSPKFKEGLNKILTNKDQVDAKLKKAGLPDEDRESFWKRAEYLTKVPMLGFGPSLLTELAANSEGVAPWDM